MISVRLAIRRQQLPVWFAHRRSHCDERLRGGRAK